MKHLIKLSAGALLMSVMAAQGQNKTLFDRAEITVEHPGSVNTIASDMCPAVVGNQMYYSSIAKELWEKAGRVRKNTAFYSQYMVPLGSEGKIVTGISPSPVKGLDQEYHQGPVTYCAKTGELFVTESNTEDPESVRRMVPRANIRLKLVIMQKKAGNWEKTSELPFNDKRYHYAHPAISAGGDTLVFSSDMPGGKGQSDLYMSVRRGGQWSTPVNLGEAVNTPGSEVFPSFLPGGLLSFSSNGHPGNYGLLDIYYTSFPKIGQVKNAGDKINSQFDDFGLIIAPNRKVGYLSSGRQGTGSDDIFQLDITEKARILSGVVYDAQTKQPLAGSQVRVVDCNGQEQKVLITDSNGKFSTEVPIGECLVTEAGAEGYQKVSERAADRDYLELAMKRADSYRLLVVDAASKEPLDQVKVANQGTALGETSAQGLISLGMKQSPGSQLQLSAPGYLNQGYRYVYRENQGQRTDTVMMYRREVGQKFVLKNINYDYNKWNILPESETELNKLVQVMNDNPGLKVELGSHTDARGNDQYNMQLSQKRSDSAVSYLVSKGIAKTRVKAKGYGESQLLNRCKNGVACSDDEHRQNRRTEFRIIGL